MSERRRNALDWLLYFGSTNEQHRRAADRAGHFAFVLAAAACTIDLVCRIRPAHGDLLAAVQTVFADLFVVLGAGGYYLWFVAVRGVAVLENTAQRWAFGALIPLTGLACSAAVWAVSAEVLTDPTRLIAAAFSGLCASLLYGLGFFGLNLWVRKRRAGVPAGDQE